MTSETLNKLNQDTYNLIKYFADNNIRVSDSPGLLLNAFARIVDGLVSEIDKNDMIVMFDHWSRSFLEIQNVIMKSYD